MLRGIPPSLGNPPGAEEIQSALRQTATVIERVLAQLNGAPSAGDLEEALRQAAAHLESARAALASASASPAGAPVSGEVLAVVSAAIATVLDGPHRILDVKRVCRPAPSVNAWAMAGRLQHFAARRNR